jgi:hypothetical protein
MFSRMFFAAVGLGAGVAVGIWTIRKLQRTSQQLAPDRLVARAGETASGLGARLTQAIEIGGAAARAKEAELRAAYVNGRGVDEHAGH